MKKIRINFKNVILFAILILALVFTGVFFAFQRTYNKKVVKEFQVVDHSDEGSVIIPEESKNSRLNILILGMEGERTDMIMLATFDPKYKTLNCISIPRDTYVENNYSDPTLKKINAVYQMKTKNGGIEGLASEVSKIMGVPVHDYVMVDYNAVAKITEAVGGVEVDIPFNMYYDDPYSKPPLHIYFQKGRTTLNADTAIKYLRWRKNNDGSHGQEGDEGRIKRQQLFIKNLLEKALNPAILPKVIEVAFEHVQTSLKLSQVMGLVSDALSMPKGNINFYQEIGAATYFNGLSYYLADKDATQKLMQKIINNEIITQEDTKASQTFISKALSRGNDRAAYVRSSPSVEEEQQLDIQSSEGIGTGGVIFNNENTQNLGDSNERNVSQTAQDINSSVTNSNNNSLKTDEEAIFSQDTSSWQIQEESYQEQVPQSVHEDTPPVADQTSDVAEEAPIF